jgi:hypothetical protein
VNTKDGARTRVIGAVALSAALLVPLAVFGAPALARSGSAGSQYGSGSSQYQYRVTICHRTGSKKHPGHTITVSAAAVRAHLRHGDHLGRCTGAETARVKSHGKGKPAKPAKPNHDAGKKSQNGNEGSSSPAAPEHGNGHGDKGHHGK